MPWNPAQYLQFAGERLRPALDLLARIPLARPRTIVDLGCGAGNVTKLLGERWPKARIVGVDSSTDMLGEARAATRNDRRYTFVAADLAQWRPDAPVDLVYSNAALHWLDDHATLFPRLMNAVAPGGALAVQMPSNFLAPSHVVLQDVVGSPRWNAQLGALLRPVPVAPAVRYFEWLSPHARTVDAWTTEYLHVLPRASDGEHPVIAWIKGTALTPFLAVLGANAQRAFIRDCTERVARAYPALADGRVLYPFRRVFMVATR